VLKTSNIVTNSLTDDLNILSDGIEKHTMQLSSPPPPRVCAAAQQQQPRQDEDEFHHDIEWLLSNRKCIGIQRFYASAHEKHPKLWRKILLYL
jgi:hypothetical protein